MSIDTIWEKPKTERNRPIRGGVMDEYMKVFGTKKQATAMDEPQKSIAREALNTGYRVYRDYLQYANGVAKQMSTDGRNRTSSSVADFQAIWLNAFESMSQLFETGFRSFENMIDIRQGEMPDFAAFGDEPVETSSRPATKWVPVTLIVKSKRTTKASLRFIPGAIPQELVVHKLRGKGLPSIPTELRTKKDEYRIQVRIRKKTPDGEYVAALVDAKTDEKVGELRLKVV